MADSKPAVLQAAGPSLAAEVSSRVRPNLRLIGLLALGHFVIDVNHGSLSAIPLAGFAGARFLPAPRHAVR